jgi:hypothetical protein
MKYRGQEIWKGGKNMLRKDGRKESLETLGIRNKRNMEEMNMQGGSRGNMKGRNIKDEDGS